MWPFDAISHALAVRRERKQARAEIAELIGAAVSGGTLTAEDERAIISRCASLKITEQELRPIRLPAYRRASAAVISNGEVADEQVRDLARIQHFLKLLDSDVSEEQRVVQRALTIRSINRGQLPTVDVMGVVRKKGETLHWCERASLLEERVVDRQYVGGSHGVSLRIAKRVTYRIGSHRGHMVSKKAVVAVSSGNLIISNIRVLFVGDRKSFTAQLAKIMDVQFFTDGIRLIEDSGRQRDLTYASDRNADIVGATLQSVLNAARA